jgi:hypothetical protein
MKNKQNPIEWLKEEIIMQMGIRIENTSTGVELIKKAEQMFEQQIKEACEYGYCKDVEDIDDEWIEQAKNEGIKYYHDTYKKP